MVRSPRSKKNARPVKKATAAAAESTAASSDAPAPSKNGKAKPDAERPAGGGPPLGLWLFGLGFVGLVALDALPFAIPFGLPIRGMLFAGELAGVGWVYTALQKRGRAVASRIAEHAAEVERRNRELSEASRAVIEAKAKTDRIMETVGEGLFLIDREYKIDAQYSKELEKIFRTSELAGRNLIDLLARLVTDRMLATIKDYFSLLFDPGKKQRTVLQVNPMVQLEVNFPDPEGGFAARFLNFTFQRILDGEQIGSVFVAVSDVTERVELERKLKQSETKKQKQFEFLIGVSHLQPTEIDDFIAGAREQLGMMNAALRQQDVTGASTGQLTVLRQRLDTVYRSVHTIKGNASVLKLEYFVNTCQEFESKISALRSKSTLTADDFLSIVLGQSELTRDVEELQEVRTRFVGIGPSGVGAQRPTAAGTVVRNTPGSDDLLQAIATLVADLAGSLKKEVETQAAGFDSRGLPDETRRAVKDVLIQLARNAVVHGIEPLNERAQVSKPKTAVFLIRGQRTEDSFSFTVRDDGRGLDPVIIRRRAVERGIVSDKAASQMSRSEIVGLIFRPGFSTADRVNEAAGRGVGMNVVKNLIVDKLGGEIGITSEPNKFTEFSFVIPLAPTPVKPIERTPVAAS